MRRLKKYFLDFSVKNRRQPARNREQVGKYLIYLSVIILFVFIVNFVIIIGTDTKFGVDLSKGAQAVYQTTRTVQAKRGTIYDRSGNPIAEDSTTYSVYAIIDKAYVSALKEKLYVQASQYDTVASIFKKKFYK